MNIQMPRESSSSDDPVLLLAQREVSLEHAAEFAPIVNGPVFAVLALIPLGVATVFYAVWKFLRNSIPSSK